ncbi:Histidine kinase-like ATPase domain-containing protein [Desulfonauticus submarinus]|uniref:Histidine kinase-like ATPase domain-containing protein n=1 Tax=Desulfonauticus submarinus TaxID=206665 RepID=A0A1H0EDD2_9BACT|nr:ATP-binding protein [Desulfonauticus submarinus]SDN80424.1 Histidine kinase-like ATPase domain-containing protein [Desulfonauticus submarinus]
MNLKIFKYNFFLKVSFYADLNCIASVMECVLDFLKGWNIDVSDFKLNLILREALNNAIIHGARLDKKKKILFWLKKEKKRLYFFIRDPGAGFNFLSFGKKPEEFCPRGWGIYLIRHYSSGCRFFYPGNKFLFWVDLEESKKNRL